MASPHKVQPVYRKVGLYEKRSDFAYWQTQSYQGRLDALEEIRQEYHGWKDGTQPRLQRVCTIIRLRLNKRAAGRAQDLADLENLE